jgi:hypothetical protein
MPTCGHLQGRAGAGEPQHAQAALQDAALHSQPHGRAVRPAQHPILRPIQRPQEHSYELLGDRKLQEHSLLQDGRRLVSLPSLAISFPSCGDTFHHGHPRATACSTQHACGATPPHSCLCVTARDWHRTVPAHLGPPAAHHTCPLDHATLPPTLPSSGTPWSRHCLHSCVRSSERLSRTSVPLCKRPRIARPRQATAES